MTYSNSVTTLPEAVAATKQMFSAQALTSTTMEFAVALQMRDAPGLQARIGRGELISDADFQNLYLPLPADYTTLKAWLISQGFTVTQDDVSRLSVFARGTVQQIQESLQTTIVGVAVGGKTYPAASTAPSLPASIAAPVLGINGLQPYRQLQKHRVVKPLTANRPDYLINEILGAFNAKNLGLTGSNQTIAILIDTVPDPADVYQFWTNNGVLQSQDNLTFINVPGTTLPATDIEETLDAEWTTGIAPGAKVRVYASGGLDDNALDKAIAQIIGDLTAYPSIHQLSISLGGTESGTISEYKTDNNYFSALAGKGVSTFVSSGDNGSTPTGAPSSTTPYGVEYYASDPNVTAVGGTSLTLNTSTGARSAESAWTGSGGGVSVLFDKPSWQTGNGVPVGSMRYVPDVSLPADPNTGAYIYYQGTASGVGGTSWSAPTWAGLCALINERRANNGLTPLGLLNPKVYPLIGTANFFDIITGSNAAATKANGNYKATAGYDRATGVGSPNVATLLATLAGQAAAAAPTVTGISPASGPAGTSVAVAGTNFSAVSGVSVGGVSAAYTVDAVTGLHVTVPAAARNGRIAVSTSSGSAISASVFTVTTTAASPTISGFTPTSGAAGASVVITGTNFSGATAVNFNGTAAGSFAVNSATQITAAVPAGAATGAISVMTASGTATSTASFTVTTTTGGGGPVVISQVYGGGGNGTAGATYKYDYVELYNSGTATVTLSSYSLQYAAATGTVWTKSNLPASVTIPSRHYYLVREGSTAGTVGADLPVTEDATGTLTLASTSGKIALVNSQTTLSSTITSAASAGIVDFVGYGAANLYEGTQGAAPTLTVSTAALRNNGGDTDTNSNANDFTAAAPNPRNSSSPTNPGTMLVPDLTITKTHAGSFTQADTGDAYTITVANSGTGPTSGTVTVIDTLPSGLTASALAGTGWTVGAGNLSASRTDALAAGASYPALTLTVNISSTAATSVTNTAAVSGGAETNTANDSASDVTAITALTPSQSWRFQYFGMTGNTGVAADTYVYAGDGLTNLVKYALGLNPLVPAVAPLTVDASTGFLRLSVTRNPNATDLAFGVEVSGDLTNASSWTTNGTTVESTSTPSLLQVHDNTSVSTAYPRSLRLRVTRP